MLNSLFDIITKKEDDRNKIIFWILKILFSIVLTGIIINSIEEVTLSKTLNLENIQSFFFKGEVIIVFGIFYLVWIISYTAIDFIISSIGFFISNWIFKIFNTFITSELLIEEDSPVDKKRIKFFRFFKWLFIKIDLIEVESTQIKPGDQFYNLNNVLIEIKENKEPVDKKEFTDTISLVLQFLVIYFSLDLKFIDSSWWLKILSWLIILHLFFQSFMVYILISAIEVKHLKILKIIDDIKSKYMVESSSNIQPLS